jgi:hypothetical protein
MVYLMRRKSEATDCLKRYLAEMKRLGWPVLNLVCDRGSEFFTQDGPIIDGVNEIKLNLQRLLTLSSQSVISMSKV